MLTGALSRTASTRHVRSLHIKGFLYLEDVGESNKEAGWETDASRADKWEQYRKDQGLDEVLGDEEPTVHGWFEDYGPVEVTAEEDAAWAPFIRLVKALPRLTKLVYDCRNQFPPTLLAALHIYHPRCRLHHLTFRLRSLLQQDPDPHEMALATSPCLHRVKLHCAWRNSNAQDDFNEEAMLELVAGLAPNLKELSMISVFPALPSSGWRDPRAAWRGLPGFVEPDKSAIGSLTSLSLVGALRFSPELLQTWHRHTDFTMLRHLVLGGGLECNKGINDETMRWMVQNCSFPRLETLRVRLRRDDEDIDKPNYAVDAAAFFRAFEPLEELSLSGPLEPEILNSILFRHGHKLKKLGLFPHENPFDSRLMHVPMILTREHIEKIQARCPAVYDLSIPIKRTNSDRTEAELYRGLGKFARLQRLFLVLDCSNWRVMRDSTLTDDPSFDDDDRELFITINSHIKRGHVRECLVNCAVDETLARSIWETICRDKITQLKSLKLYTTGGGKFGNTSSYWDLRKLVSNMSRSFIIERAGEEDDSISVRELGGRARIARDQQYTRWEPGLAG
ncbi:hypothetical protein Daus18300_012156 [Diaporthe australafricana]|uniref:F-box domain-containing protein n=1 Tax=Diaporthe australafricana TaxID=127596 RepID=A0ABR3W3T6_9PEZI